MLECAQEPVFTTVINGFEYKTGFKIEVTADCSQARLIYDLQGADYKQCISTPAEISDFVSTYRRSGGHSWKVAWSSRIDASARTERIGLLFDGAYTYIAFQL